MSILHKILLLSAISLAPMMPFNVYGAEKKTADPTQEMLGEIQTTLIAMGQQMNIRFDRLDTRMGNLEKRMSLLEIARSKDLPPTSPVVIKNSEPSKNYKEVLNTENFPFLKKEILNRYYHGIYPTLTLKGFLKRIDADLFYNKCAVEVIKKPSAH